MNKYHNKKTVLDGIKFDSKKEANRYAELKLMKNAGEIWGLILQPRYTIIEGFEYKGKKIRKSEYVADFAYYEKGQEYVIEDVKSDFTRKDPTYRLKKKLLLARIATEPWNLIHAPLMATEEMLRTVTVKFVEFLN